MLADAFTTTAPTPPSRTEPELAVLAFFASTRRVASSSHHPTLDSADGFTIAQIATGTGLDRRAVIDACFALSELDGEDVDDTLIVHTGSDGGDLRFALNQRSSTGGAP